MEATRRLDDVDSGTEPEVIRVAEDDLRVEIVGLEFFEANAFDGPCCADRHKDWSFDLAATSGQHARPRLILLSNNLETQCRHTHLQKNFSLPLCAFA